MKGPWRKGMSERGSALVITLLIITTLVGVTIAFSEESNIELSLAAYSRDGFSAYLAALGGCERARALIDSDEDKSVDSLLEEWARFGVEHASQEVIEGAGLIGEVVDESGKFNLNALVNKRGEAIEGQVLRLERLFKLLGLDEARVNPLVDWIDADDEKRLEGAESDYYRSLSTPYSCANGPFLTVGQIFLVKDLSPKASEEEGEQSGSGRRLLDYVTIYGDGKVNVNTASREVIQCLDEEIDSGIADAVLAFRAKEDFRSLNDLKKVSGMNDEIFTRIRDFISVKSSCFSLDMEGKYGDSAARIHAVLSREEEKSKLIYWRVM